MNPPIRIRIRSDYEDSQGDMPTREDLIRAALELRAFEVPPFKCEACGVTFFAMMPSGWPEGGARHEVRCPCCWALAAVV